MSSTVRLKKADMIRRPPSGNSASRQSENPFVIEYGTVQLANYSIREVKMARMNPLQAEDVPELSDFLLNIEQKFGFYPTT